MSSKSEPELALEVNLTGRDFLRAHFWSIYYLGRARIWALGLLMLTGILLALMVAILRPPDAGALNTALWAALLITILAVALPLRVAIGARQTARRAPKRIHYHLSQEGLRWIAGDASARSTNWVDVQRVAESRNAFYLLANRGVHIFPKRSLQASQAAALRNRLQSLPPQRAAS